MLNINSENDVKNHLGNLLPCNDKEYLRAVIKAYCGKNS